MPLRHAPALVGGLLAALLAWPLQAAPLVQLTLDDFEGTLEIMDMLLAKKRAGDRKSWLEAKGNLAEVLL